MELLVIDEEAADDSDTGSNDVSAIDPVITDGSSSAIASGTGPAGTDVIGGIAEVLNTLGVFMYGSVGFDTAGYLKYCQT